MAYRNYTHIAAMKRYSSMKTTHGYTKSYPAPRQYNNIQHIEDEEYVREEEEWGKEDYTD